jgi:hypothetical protein
MRAVHVGIADHFGWAVAVTADDDHHVVDRRRIALVEDGVCEAPIHYEGARLGVEGAAALVAQVRASAQRACAAALDELARDLPAPVATFSLRVWPDDFPQDLEVQLRVPWEARADAVMYRQVLAEAAHERGWALHTYLAKDVEARAAAVLGPSARAVLHGPKARLGPPWAKDHRSALAAAVLAAQGG